MSDAWDGLKVPRASSVDPCLDVIVLENREDGLLPARMVDVRHHRVCRQRVGQRLFGAIFF